jgi:hypothetical protein
MTHADAARCFDTWPADRKDRVIYIFDSIRCSNIFPSVHDAFIAAVEDECKAIETEMLIGQQAEGRA